MASTSTLTESEVALDKLILDDTNPRFAQLYTGKSQEDIINYLLDEEDARDLAKVILNDGSFRQDKKLWVLKQNDGKYLVKDGNRRCAAVKALQNPEKYILTKSLPFTTLPVIIYDNETLLNEHIQGEHTSASKKDWSRIAKALEIHRLAHAKASRSEMRNIDSEVSQLLRVANFYEKAVAISKDKLRELLRNRGSRGGKLIIFERMFGVANECGYAFNGIKSNCSLNIIDKKIFETYVKNIVNYLYDHPETTHANVDKKDDQINFLALISTKQKKVASSNHGTTPENSPSGGVETGNPTSQPKASPSSGTSTSKGSVKTKPKFKRKDIPPQVKKVIDELYHLNPNTYPNSKAAMTRVVLELALKYVTENTKYDTKNTMDKSPYFKKTFPSQPGQYTKAASLKNSFAELIKNTGIKKALINFDWDKPSQTIHNYHAGMAPINVKQWCDDLIDILEFVLNDELELLNNLDLTKL